MILSRSTASASVVDVPKKRTFIGPSISFCEDRNGTLRLDDVIAGHCRFVRSHSQSLGFGYSDSAYWLKFTVRNNADSPKKLLLEIDNPIIDTIELYVPSVSANTPLTAGDRVPLSQWPIIHRNALLPVTAVPGLTECYLRVRSSSNLSLPAILWDERAFKAADSRENIFLWIFYGIMSAMVIYHLLLLVSSRDPGYLYYALAAAGFIFFRLAYNGLAYIHLWPNSIWWANTAVPFFISFFVVFLIQFTRNFLQTRTRLPVMDRVLIGLMLYFGAGTVFSLVGPYSLAIRAVLFMGAVTCIVLVSFGAYLLYRGIRESAFYLAGWGLFLVGSFLNILRDFGIAPITFVTTWGQQIGAVFQMMLFSLGLADKLNIMEQKISITQGELRDKSASLEHERELMSVTLRSITDAVVTVELDGTLVLMNRVAEHLTGWNWSDARGKSISEIFTMVREGTSEAAIPPIEEVMHTGVPAEVHNGLLIVSRKGTARHIAYGCAPLRDSSSRIIGAVLVFRDVTEQIRIERELIKTSKLETLSAFAGGIAHDFNNILTVIIGNLSLMKTSAADEFTRDILDDTEKITFRASELTRQLLTFSKGGDPIKKLTDVKNLLQETSSFITGGSKATISYDLPSDLWGADIDEGQISQAVNNLVINALQAMPRGGNIAVRASNLTVRERLTVGERTVLQPGEYLVISVADQGVGIDPDVLPRIYEPFFTTKPEGNGIGLSSTLSIVRKHGGQITVETDAGRGTVFCIYLPSIGKPVPVEAPRRGGLVTGSGRILVLDDEILVLKAASRLLTRLGYSVETATDGEEAAEKYAAAKEEGNPFTAVIMDLTIPGRTGGREALTIIRKTDPAVKAVVSSGYSNDPILADFRSYGFADVIVKPYNLTSLSETLARVIEPPDDPVNGPTR